MTHLWRIIREPSSQETTLGSLYMDGEWAAWTLEDEILAEKIPNETAIPAGRYPVRLSWSPKFQRNLPEVRDVPNYSGIRFHSGNRKDDTAGCIIVGFQRSGASITGGTSRPAEYMIVSALEAIEAAEDDVIVLIEDPMVRLEGA